MQRMPRTWHEKSLAWEGRGVDIIDFLSSFFSGVGHSFDIIGNLFSPGAIAMLTVVALLIGGGARVSEGEENAANKVLCLVGIVGLVGIYAWHSWQI